MEERVLPVDGSGWGPTRPGGNVRHLREDEEEPHRLIERFL
jgi:hypothetical protein